jgi:AcrR family transcriptional regulator
MEADYRVSDAGEPDARWAIDPGPRGYSPGRVHRLDALDPVVLQESSAFQRMSTAHTDDRRLAPRKTVKQARAQLTVDAILDAASQVFESRGYASATTNRIAERAGVSIGSLYQYFPNKDAILVALTHRHLAEGMAVLEPQLRRLQEGEPWDEVLPDVVSAMVAMHAVAPMLHRCLFEETRLPRTVRDELEALEDALVDLTADALAAGPVDAQGDARLAARIVVNVIESLTHRLVLRPHADAGSEDVAREITLLVRAYLRARHAVDDRPEADPAPAKVAVITK